MNKGHWPIPDIPGTLLEDEEVKGHLLEHLSNLCGLNSARFPGSQPVSFSTASLELLESKDFWVCEKTDGVRVLVFIVMNQMRGSQEVWLVDRKGQFSNVSDLHFPHWENHEWPLTDTVLDGELVIDIDPKTQAQILRFYGFDMLVVHGTNIMKKPLRSRYGRLKEWIIAPFNRGLEKEREWRENLPFEILAKDQELSYHISTVVNVHIPKLLHGHDGLIFTCAESEYVPGTDEKILKWKPPSENTIDFRLELRFPPSPANPSEPDFCAKPVFLLNVWKGEKQRTTQYEYFDELEVDDEEWERMKESKEQIDDRVVECYWDKERNAWRLLRVRNDKTDGNYISIVHKILKSIEDGVELDTIIAHSDVIRGSWKAREAAARGLPPPTAQFTQQPLQTPGPRTDHSMPTPSVRGSVGASGGGGGGGGGGPAYPPTSSTGPAPGHVNHAPPPGVMAGLRR